MMHRSDDAPDNRMLLHLNLKKLVQEPLVIRIQLPNVIEDVPDKFFQPFGWDDGWVR